MGPSMLPQSGPERFRARGRSESARVARMNCERGRTVALFTNALPPEARLSDNPGDAYKRKHKDRQGDGGASELGASPSDISYKQGR